MDDIEKCVLQENHRLIVNNVSVKQSEVLAYLLQNGTITDHEYDDVLTRTTQISQTTRLLYIIKRRDRDTKPFINFISAIEKEYSYISEKLKTQYDTLKDAMFTSSLSRRKETGVCSHCYFVQNLIPEHITHILYQYKVINDDQLENLNNPLVSSMERNKRLLDVIRDHRKPKRAAKILLESLQEKYAYLRRTLKISATDGLPVECQCVGKLDTTTDDESTDRDDCQTYGKISRQIESKLSLCRSIRKHFPQNLRTMKLCRNLWDTLFNLREKGDWAKFRQLTSAAFEKYSNDFDIQVLLYRSEMCIATFYNNDSETASKMYEKACSLVPHTSMPTWHTARILPLKVELHTKSKQYSNAESLLHDAKQAMSNLQPCLSTGAVHFFEAKYLSSLLRCNKCSHSSKSIRDRIKTSYLTAIEHYQNEKVFGIRSFLNQVYLFLALFALGIDPAEPQAPDPGGPVSRGDLDLAQHYLNLFENTAWDSATCWSKLHFYLAKAEHHRQKDNTMRSLDFLALAQDMAEEGEFKVHQEFINLRIEHLKNCQVFFLQSKGTFDVSIEELLNRLSE